MTQAPHKADEPPKPRTLRDAAGKADATVSKVAGLSITDFLTDGSLVRLCDELSAMLSVSVRLFDASGRLVTRGDAGEPWVVRETDPSVDLEPGQTRIPLPAECVCVPLKTEGHTIGSLVIAGGEPSLSPDARSQLERVLSLVAGTASELCEHELDLRHRIKEVSALYKLSSLLARATNLERVLNVALELSLDMLDLDAGAVVLFPEEAEIDEIVRGSSEQDVLQTASKGLSRRWLEDTKPLSHDRLFDRMAANGEIVVSEDLQNDDRVLGPERLALEELGATIQAGMVVHGRPLGVIRLYSRLPRSFDEADRRILRSITQQAAVAVQQARLMKVREDEQRIQRQLQLAADVQRRMLPRSVPGGAGSDGLSRLDVAAKYVPSFELGGDFYDFIQLHNHLGVVVGDVVGKGVAAALLMAAVRSSLRAYAHNVYDIDEVISRVNVALCRDTLDNEFATLWYGVFDPAHLRLTYCSAGHEPPLILRVPSHRAPTSADMDELGVGGMVVGIDKSQRYQRAVYDLHPGDVFIAYTDGVTDTTNFSREKFGKKRLRKAILDLLAAEPKATASRVSEHIHWSLRQFAGLAPRADDETIVVVRVSPDAPHTPRPH